MKKIVLMCHLYTKIIKDIYQRHQTEISGGTEIMAELLTLRPVV